jgi:hypothetical protein
MRSADACKPLREAAYQRQDQAQVILIHFTRSFCQAWEPIAYKRGIGGFTTFQEADPLRSK